MRGSGEFHAFADATLYLRRKGNQLLLSAEHRAERSLENVSLQLNVEDQNAPFLQVAPQNNISPEAAPSSPEHKIIQLLKQSDSPLKTIEIRDHTRLRTATVSHSLKTLTAQGLIVHSAHGYALSQT